MKTTTRDNILYLTIALAIVMIALLAFRYHISSGEPLRPLISQNAFSFVLTTSVVLGCLIQAWRKAWHRARFWFVLAVVCAAYLPLQWQLVHYLGSRLALLTLVAGLELIILSIIFDTAMENLNHRNT
jgi:hypothetical protein